MPFQLQSKLRTKVGSEGYLGNFEGNNEGLLNLINCLRDLRYFISCILRANWLYVQTFGSQPHPLMLALVLLAVPIALDVFYQ